MHEAVETDDKNAAMSVAPNDQAVGNAEKPPQEDIENDHMIALQLAEMQDGQYAAEQQMYGGGSDYMYDDGQFHTVELGDMTTSSYVPPPAVSHQDPLPAAAGEMDGTLPEESMTNYPIRPLGRPPRGVTENELKCRETVFREPSESMNDSAVDQRMIIQSLRHQATMEVGQVWFLLSRDWFLQWSHYVQFNATEEQIAQQSNVFRAKPPAVDNTPLVEEGTTLCVDGLIEHHDFHVISPLEWRQYMDWYGGGPELGREVIGTGCDYAVPEVEVRPMRFHIIRAKSSESRIMFYSAATTVYELLEEQCAYYGLDLNHVRVWDYHEFQRTMLLDDLENRLDDTQLFDNQALLLEEQLENGEWPEAPTHEDQTYTSTSSVYGNFDHDYGSVGGGSFLSFEGEKGKSLPGTTGLCNLGNTCYLNSSVQCLSNFLPLSSYFLSGKFKTELNKDNVLGFKGDLASEYATLLKILWGGEYVNYVPKDFRSMIGKCAEAFANYSQQDSQEFLSFLLDGLHEDLNRVLVKPSTTPNDSPDRPDHIAAEEEWQRHKLRNDSIVVDWCQGQLKNRLQCNVCGKLSIKFDPFMTLSVPVPIKFASQVLITVFRRQTDRPPVQYRLKLPSKCTGAQMRAQLSAMCKIKERNLYIVEVYAGRIFREINLGNQVAISVGDEIVAYEIVAGESQRNEKKGKDLSLPAAAAVNTLPSSIDQENDVQDSSSQPVAAAAKTDMPQESEAEQNISPEEEDGKEEKEKKIANVDPPPPAMIRVQVLFCKRRRIPTFYGTSTVLRNTLIGVPLIINVSSHVTYNQLYRIIWSYIKQWSKPEGMKEVREEYENWQKVELAKGNSESTEKNQTGDATPPIVPNPSSNHEDLDVKDVTGTTTSETKNSVAMDSSSSSPDETNPVTSGLQPKEEEKNTMARISEKSEAEISIENDHALATAYAEAHFGGCGVPRDTDTLRSQGEEAWKQMNANLGNQFPTQSTSKAEQMLAKLRAQAMYSDTDEEDDSYDETDDDGWGENAYGAELRASGGVSNFSNPLYQSASKSTPRIHPEKIIIPPDPDELFEIYESNEMGSKIHTKNAFLEKKNTALGLTDFVTVTVSWDAILLRKVVDVDKFEAPPVMKHKSCAQTEEELKPILLEDCLAHFGKVEQLSGEDGWFCSQCKKHQSALKTLSLWRLPRLLIIHLKRFGSMHHKITDAVKFPLHKLDLSKWCGKIGSKSSSPAPIYDLYAVSNHYGDLQGGHYTACAKSRLDGKWYAYNDSAVTEMSEDDVCSSDAYVLFYQRVDSMDEKHTHAITELLASQNPGTKSANKGKQEDIDPDAQAAAGDIPFAAATGSGSSVDPTIVAPDHVPIENLHEEFQPEDEGLPGDPGNEKPAAETIVGQFVESGHSALETSSDPLGVIDDPSCEVPIELENPASAGSNLKGPEEECAPILSPEDEASLGDSNTNVEMLSPEDETQV